jgi:hypothetical protein
MSIILLRTENVGFSPPRLAFKGDDKDVSAQENSKLGD